MFWIGLGCGVLVGIGITCFAALIHAIMDDE